MNAEEHTCATTGLHLIPADGSTAFRTAKDRHGAISAKPNQVVGHWPIGSDESEKDFRGRFDTIGTTIYLSDSHKCSYAEVLAVFRKKRASIARVAELIGLDPDTYIKQVIEEAAANGRSTPWAIPLDWQTDRSLYEVQMPSSGWWVQIDHADTLKAIETITPTISGLTEDLRNITETQIMSNDRAITTHIANSIRETNLGDGTRPLGISFRSKTSFGRCWAYWDFRTDESLEPSDRDLIQDSSIVLDSDSDFYEIADHYGLEVLTARS